MVILLETHQFLLMYLYALQLLVQSLLFYYLMICGSNVVEPGLPPNPYSQIICRDSLVELRKECLTYHLT